ncbi:hypothetical protein Naga_100021g15 [Nannochloropsis gaditana]|uniref:Uncharacterized protein n=1 Tax=Nannochloropsis gaditana TaxID=72520 RepID=W7TQK7_9STRA|nr:hypothetical protein Naga_100021g15 [Nannochloropsis gaditana]
MTGFTYQAAASPDNQFQVLYHTLRFISRSDPPARNQVNTGFCVSSHMMSSRHLFPHHKRAPTTSAYQTKFRYFLRDEPCPHNRSTEASVNWVRARCVIPYQKLLQAPRPLNLTK